MSGQGVLAVASAVLQIGSPQATCNSSSLQPSSNHVSPSLGHCLTVPVVSMETKKTNAAGHSFLTRLKADVELFAASPPITLPISQTKRRKQIVQQLYNMFTHHILRNIYTYS
ncbi:hypothetical protein GOODEAATRI_016328 [Goodea atripinnis]|uniref:Uncharacterized protein n=1 Tax=Goodea atripinnis TaxID=208336 RepID=A0ABV0NV03_9TELE